MFKRIINKFKPKAKVKPKVKKTVKPKAKVKKTVKPKAGGKPKMTASERDMLKAIPKRVKDKINKKIKADQQGTGSILNPSKKPVTIKESIAKSGILKTSGSSKKAAQDYMDRIRRMKKGGRAK